MYEYVTMYHSLMYWYGESLDLYLLDSLNRQLIDVYVRVTGVQGARADELEAAFAAKDQAEEYCSQELADEQKKNRKLTRRIGLWKVLAIVNGTLVVLIAGVLYVITLI